MPKYKVKIVPVAYILIVEAKNKEEANRKAMKRFDSGDYEDDENGGETIITKLK